MEGLPAPLAELANKEKLMSTAVRLPPTIIEQVDALADQLCVGRAAVLRALVTAGLNRVDELKRSA